MTRPLTTLLAVLLVVGALVASPAAALAPATVFAQEETPTTTPTNATNASNTSNATVAPGERLAGVVGVQHAEVEGEIETRAYGLEIAGAATAEARAEVVAERLERNRQRLDTLHERKAALTAARENGSLSDGAYRAQIAILAAETATVKQTLNQSAAVSAELPAEVLIENGVNVTAIQTLKASASTLTGPEVAAIAQSIAGKSLGATANEARGPDASEQARNRTTDRPGSERSSATGPSAATPPSERSNQPQSGSVSGNTSTSTTDTATTESDEGSEPSTSTRTDRQSGTSKGADGSSSGSERGSSS